MASQHARSQPSQSTEHAAKCTQEQDMARAHCFVRKRCANWSKFTARLQCSRRCRVGAHLDDRRDELDKEAGHLQERGVEVVQVVHDEALDVAAVLVLVRHDHHLAVPQRLGVAVRLRVLQPDDLLQRRDLRVVVHLRGMRDVVNTAPTQPHWTGAERGTVKACCGAGVARARCAPARCWRRGR